MVCKGNYKTANGYIWSYGGVEIDKNEHIKKKKGTEILQLDKVTNEVIKEYESVAEAGRKLNVKYKCIHKVLDKPNRTAYRFKWVTKKLYTNTEVK